MKKSLWLIIVILTAGIIFFVYGFYIEPHRIETTKINIKIKGLSDALSGFSIIHLSDLHLENIGKREIRLLRMVNGLNPDIIVITGDFVNKRGAVDDCIKLISKFKARYGKWGVWGNFDYFMLNQEDRERLSESGIVILSNENRSIKVNKQSMWIIGVDDPVCGYDDLSRAANGIPKGDFKLLLAHSPAIIDEAHRAGIELVLAGHTHGGQVYLPLISHLIVRLHGGKGYIGGLYRVGQTYLYVNRGIGTSILPLRAFSPPEITLIKLEKEKAH